MAAISNYYSKGNTAKMAVCIRIVCNPIDKYRGYRMIQSHGCDDILATSHVLEDNLHHALPRNPTSAHCVDIQTPCIVAA